MVTERVQMLQWLFRTMDLPMTPSTVIPLRDLPDGASVKSEQLVNMQSSSGCCIGAWVPRVLRPDDPKMLRPVDSKAHLNDRRFLTMGEDDAMHIQRLFGEGASPVIIPGASPSGSGLVASPKRSKLEANMDNLMSTSRRLLQQFESSDWSFVKESQFTNPVAKWSSFSAEATNAGEEVLISTASAWVCGLTAGKQFLRQQREYVQSKHKSQKLVVCFPSMKQFRDFLQQDVKLQLDARFEMLWFKASFNIHTPS